MINVVWSYHLNFSGRDADETSTVGSHESTNGFDMNGDDQATDLVLGFVKKFVDKICDESGVNSNYKNSLHTKLYRSYLSFDVRGNEKKNRFFYDRF